MTSARPVLITAGGTGGHVFPALAVAECLRAAGIPLLWLGTRHGIETRLVPAHGIELRTVAISGLRGHGPLRLLLAPIVLGAAVLRSLALLARVRPRVVLGMGGFAAGPAGLAAWLLRVPLVVHEQNAVAGLTNRLLAPLARCVLQGFPDAFPAGRRARTTGNPVRREVLALAPPQARSNFDEQPLRVLVLGGSQGASVFNERMPEVFAALGPQACAVWHQSGTAGHQATVAHYARSGVAARVEPFIEDMASAYGWAHLVVCRAGALTVCELAAAGVGAVLVPFPHAVDDHQSANARYLQARAAAIVLEQPQFTVARVCALLGELGAARARLREMAMRARDAAQPGAAERVAASCLEVARG